MTAVLVVASDHVGSSMAAPGIRYLWFARELARRGHDVTLVVPFDTDLAPEQFAIRVDNPWHAGRMTKLAVEHDAVVAQRLPVPTMLRLARSSTRVVYDLCAPLTIEHAALASRRDAPSRPAFELDQLTLRTALETGDAFVCASERQRDLWLGALVAVGRVGPQAYHRDPSFRTLVTVVPFGVDPEPPSSETRVLKGVVPGIGEGDTVALWGGGIWEWLDPLIVIRAVHALRRDDLRLFFLGTRSPNPAVPPMSAERRARELASQLRLLGESVFFNDGWVPYATRGAYLLEADAGVSAHFDELETRFAVRSRVLDCIWARLPVVTTGGDALADLVGQRRLGRVVEPGDVDGYAHALAAVLDGGRAAFDPAFEETRRELAWPQVVVPLAAILAGEPTRSVHRSRIAARARHAGLRARVAWEARGATGIAGRLAAGVKRRLRGDRAAHPHDHARPDGERRGSG